MVFIQKPIGYYVYAYIRSKDSTTATAGTPYYIGKGKDDRAWRKHRTVMTPTNANVIILEHNLTEIGALALERRMIAWYGRKDVGTGILHNRTDGGEGASGAKRSDERRKQISLQTSGKNNLNYGKSPSLEIRKAISNKLSGENNPFYGKFGSEHPAFGKKHTPENIQHFIDTRQGEDSPRALLTNDDVTNIREELFNNPYRGQAVVLARKYGVHKSTISKIKMGKNWKNNGG